MRRSQRQNNVFGIGLLVITLTTAVQSQHMWVFIFKNPYKNLKGSQSSGLQDSVFISLRYILELKRGKKKKSHCVNSGTT